MEGSGNDPVIIDVPVDGGEATVRFKVGDILSNEVTSSLTFNVCNSNEHSRTIHIPHVISRELRQNLIAGGFGYFIKLIPVEIDALLIPAVSKDIWNISVIKGEILTNNEHKDNGLALLNDRGYFNNILTISGLKNVPNFIVNKTYDELVGKVPKSEDLRRPLGLTNEQQPTNAIEDPEKVIVINQFVSTDPTSFLGERYYSMLFTEKSIISHFSKSSLPKLHLICNKDNKQIFETINNLLIPDIEGLHSKYSNILKDGLKLEDFTINWISKESNFCSIEEAKYKRIFCDHLKKSVTSGLNLFTSETFSDKWNNLKIKETKLQIILALELLKIVKSAPLIGKEFSTPIINKKPIKRKRNVLVGKKKRLMPTLLGTVIPRSSNFDFDFRNQETQPLEERIFNEKTLRTTESLVELINVLFDILIVQDALVGRNHKDQSSAYLFITGNLIPYYEKDHLSVLKQLVGKVRGASYLTKRKTKRDKERKMREKQERSLKRKKSKHADISVLKNELKLKRDPSESSDLKLKRTHSSFTSNIDWERKGFDMVKSSSNLASSQRQFDMDILTSTNTLSDDLLSSQPKSQTLGGFMNSRKRQRELKAQYVSPQKVIEPETPKKIKKRMEVLKNMFANESNIKAGDVIEATPAKNRIRAMPDENDFIPANKNSRIEMAELSAIMESPFQIKRTPVKGKQRKLGIGLINETPVKSNSVLEINSTPMKPPTPIKMTIEETPKITRVEIKPGIFEITSSPFRSPEGGKDFTPRNPHRVIVESPLIQMKHASTRIKSANTPSKVTNRKLNFN